MEHSERDSGAEKSATSTKPARRGGHGGVVFTPPGLASRLLEGWIEAQDPNSPLLDPACGDGALLLAALEARGGGSEVARSLHGIEIDPKLAARARERLARASGSSIRDFEHSIVHADALDPQTTWPAGAAVIANPPWLSFSGRHAGSVAAPEAVGGWPSLQGAFLVRIARHCGEYAVSARLLLPASLMDLPRYEPARAATFSHAHVAGSPLELGEEAFPGVIEPAVCVTLEPGSTSDAFPSAETPPIVARLRHFPKLPPKTFADPGVHTGNAAVELVCDGERAGWARLRRGADLDAFDLRPASMSLRLDLERTQRRRFRFGPLEHYCEFPVLLRQTSARPIAALHREPTYFRNSLLAARSVPGLAAEFLVALFNSSIAGEWINASFRDARQRSFPQMKVGALQTLPTPISARSENPKLHDEVVQRVTQLDPRAAGFASAIAELDALITAAFDADPPRSQDLYRP